MKQASVFWIGSAGNWNRVWNVDCMTSYYSVALWSREYSVCKLILKRSFTAFMLMKRYVCPQLHFCKLRGPIIHSANVLNLLRIFVYPVSSIQWNYWLVSFQGSACGLQGTFMCHVLGCFNLPLYWHITVLQGWKSQVQFQMKWLEFFSWPNPSSCTMGQGSTQPLKDMSTRNQRSGLKADNFTSIFESTV
jgi:hypothetical protein